MDLVSSILNFMLTVAWQAKLEGMPRFVKTSQLAEWWLVSLP